MTTLTHAARTALKDRVDQERRIIALRSGDTSVIDADDEATAKMIQRLAGAVCLDSPIDLVAHLKAVAAVVTMAKAKAAQ